MENATALPWALIKQCAHAQGFARVGVADTDLRDAAPGLRAWLAAGHHGTMDYMARHADLRTQPDALVPGTVAAIMVSLDYLPPAPGEEGAAADAPGDPPDWRAQAWRTLEHPEAAYVARYAVGRDYHRVVRQRLARLVDTLRQAVEPFGARVFCDSAPVLEVELARRAGIGWRGKHTLLIDRQAGSMRFIGTVYIDRPVRDTPAADTGQHCGSCTRCLDICPTQAIVAPWQLDARRCISYLTIEHAGAIPEALRPALGNRIYGCDDCQLICPWNRFAEPSRLVDFAPRNALDSSGLIPLFQWTADDFATRLQGSPIRRIGYARWQRNLAVALGNALQELESGAEAASENHPDRTARAGAIREVLTAWLGQPAAARDPLVEEHVCWALQQGRPSGALSGRGQPQPA